MRTANIERSCREEKARRTTREALRTKVLARMTHVQAEANADRGMTDPLLHVHHERVGHGKVGEKRRVGDERGCFMYVWTRQFISN